MDGKSNVKSIGLSISKKVTSSKSLCVVLVKIERRECCCTCGKARTGARAVFTVKERNKFGRRDRELR